MDTGITAGWTDFFVATAGAAGALAGLLFVALSINLARILELPGVATRGAETIILLSAALVACLVALVPHLSPVALGLWLLVVWLGAWALPSLVQLRDFRRRQYHSRGTAVFRIVLYQIATVPGVVAGVRLITTADRGLGWFAAGVLFSLVVALVNAWVLLVEIMR